jgi:transcriptional regulator with XRE-family HTH domain
MARPKGFLLNRAALEDILRLRGLSMTEAAARSGVALTTLSGLAATDHRASIRTAHQLAQGIECAVGTLFPELTTRFAEVQADGAPLETVG